MIQTSPMMRILVATQPVDFRKGIDGLAAICRQQLEQDPMTGCAFVLLWLTPAKHRVLPCFREFYPGS